MKRRITALLLALAMLVLGAVGALADDEEASAAAQTAPPDATGTLSFENLGARMLTGSQTLLALEESISAIGSINYDELEEELRLSINQLSELQWSMQSMALPSTGNDMIDAALGGMASMMGQSAAASLSQQYNACRSTFDAIRNGKLQKDNGDLIRQLKNSENTILMMGDTMYITLLGLEETSAALDRQSAALERTLSELELRYRLGQISALTLEQAKAGRATIESGKASLDASIAALRRQLNSMVGEELTAATKLNALPTVTAEQLAALDVEKDLERAKAASYSLYAAGLTLKDADEAYSDSLRYDRDYKQPQAEHTWKAAQHTYNATVQSFELSFRSLFDSIGSYAKTLEAAKVTLECERADLKTAQLKYEQGTISEHSLRTAEDELRTAQDAVSGAERDLFTAYNNYQWAVQYGLLNS